MGPGEVSNLAFSGEFAGTFSDTSLWGCQHSEIRKLKSGLPAHSQSSGLPAHPSFPRKSHESFSNETFLWAPQNPHGRLGNVSGGRDAVCVCVRRCIPLCTQRPEESSATFFMFLSFIIGLGCAPATPICGGQRTTDRNGLSCCHLGLGIRLGPQE